MVVDINALKLRDAEGKLLPCEIQSDLFKGTVKFVRVSDGDLNEMQTNQEKYTDDTLIKKFLIEPKLTDEDLKELPRASKTEIVKLILMTTGMTREQVEASMAMGMEAMQSNIKKKLTVTT